MENQLKVPKHGSMPPFSEEDKEVSSSRFSATHPSVQSRNDLLNRIRSGNDVLCRLPTRIDPNITFSDDDEEDDSPKKPERENQAPPLELSKTPKLKLPVLHTLPSERLRRTWSAKDDFTPRVNRQVPKAPTADLFGKNRVPLTDVKAPKSSDLYGKNRVPLTDIKAPKSSDLYGKNRVPVTDIKAAKSSDLYRKNRVPLTDIKAPKSSDLCGKNRVPLTDIKAAKSSALYGKNHDSKEATSDIFSKNRDSKSSTGDIFVKNRDSKSSTRDIFVKNHPSKSDLVGKNHPVKVRQPTKMSLMTQPEFKVPLPAANNPSHDTIVINGKPYSILSQLGSGGSCKVFSVFDENKTLVAVKCVDLKGTDPLIREGYKKEIEYLSKLQGSNRVIKLFDFEYRENELFLVLERGEIDFARYISKEAKLKRLTPLTIKFFWAQMLEAVSDIHQYGIVHSDLKPANFLLVSGNLKLIDFGIATSVPEDMTSTFRDTQVGTLNYMSPEAITQLSTSTPNEIRFKVGVKSDVWSLGCILYNLVYGTTPFHSMKTLMQKIHAITNPSHKIEFRPIPDELLMDVLKKCLERDPKRRASVEELLQHPYLKEAPSSSKIPADQMSSVMAQMQVLTPRRMGMLAKVVQELSGNQG